MGLLTPLFLIGLAALAVPVLLHLIQREKKHVVHFPSLMFLQKIPYESVRRRSIRHWLLLMMRLAALALVVLAFARPFFKRPPDMAAAQDGGREVVVLLDRSYSMSYGDRWTRALAAATDAINGLGGSDRASVVLFASGAEVALRSTSDKSRLNAAVATAQPSSGATRYGPALKLAGSILAESSLPRREVILVSDFQRSGWQGTEGVRLPMGAVLTPISIGDGNVSNFAVTPVSIERSTFSGQQRAAVTAGVVNHSADARPVSVALEIDGRAVQTRQLSVEAHSSTSVTFDPVTVAPPAMRASIRIPEDGMAADNAFHFVVAPGLPVKVIVAQRAGGNSGLYLSRALNVGESPRFDVVVKDPDAVNADDLRTTAVVILNDVNLAPSTADRFVRFVEGGGGLLIAAGPKSQWPDDRAPILPAVLKDPVDRMRREPSRLVGLEYGHSIFEPFRAPRAGDFAAARFYGYRTLEPLPGSTILARFDDGSAALVEKRTGSGRVVVWASSLDVAWNDLALKPVYLPFVHQIARYLAAYREPAAWMTVGDVLDPARAGMPSKATIGGVVSPAGKALSIDGEGDVLALEEHGFYELRDQTGRSSLVVPVAANVDLSESDLTPMDPRELAAASTTRAADESLAATLADQEMTDQEREASQRIWWYLLFAGAILLAAETIVSNRTVT